MPASSGWQAVFMGVAKAPLLETIFPLACCMRAGQSSRTAPSTGWRPTHVCSLTTSAPNDHNHDGAKTRLSPPVVPPHGGAAGDAMDGRRSGQQRTYTLGTLSSTDPIRQPRTLSTCRREGQSRAECLGERRQPRGLKGRKAPGTLLPQPPCAAAGAGGA